MKMGAARSREEETVEILAGGQANDPRGETGEVQTLSERQSGLSPGELLFQQPAARM
jgi:hypothetical protein